VGNRCSVGLHVRARFGQALRSSMNGNALPMADDDLQPEIAMRVLWVRAASLWTALLACQHPITTRTKLKLVGRPS
jgi:hypothetical protein